VCTPGREGAIVALTDLGIKTLKAKPKRYLVNDARGLYIEVLPSGKKSWIYRFRVNGRPGKVQIGDYPDVSLRGARDERDIQRKEYVNKKKSPAEEKRIAKVGLAASTTVQGFGEKFFADVIKANWADPSDLRRYLDNDVYPRLGNRPVKDITPFHIQEVVFAKRDSGAPAAARALRSLLRQLFDYAVARQIVEFNPVLSLKAKQVAKLTPRDRSLSPEEIRRFLQTLYGSNTTRCLQIALHLILLTLVRKSELLHARWEHVDFEAGEWVIPKEHSKNKREHIVYLSSQALGLFRELQMFAGGSALVLPGRLSLNRPYAHSVLNNMLDSLDFGIPPFTVHDLRRTASTLLHERDFPSDVIEMALNHKKPGVRGVYNKAQYAEQRKKMLQFWADCVEGLAAEKKVLVGHFMRA
jgi:integrase